MLKLTATTTNSTTIDIGMKIDGGERERQIVDISLLSMKGLRFYIQVGEVTSKQQHLRNPFNEQNTKMIWFLKKALVTKESNMMQNNRLSGLFATTI
jgi:hypothetical protein